MSKTRIIKTLDGSDTLYREDIDETYHSRNGALTESLHVFVGNGLEHHIEKNPQVRATSVLEVGFGTGLNAALTCRFAAFAKRAVNYVSLEPFPVEEKVVNRINYFENDPEMRALFQDIHKAPWELPWSAGGFTLIKRRVPLQDFATGDTFDVIYFDAFAPEKQPEMWTLDVMRQLHDLMNPGGVLTTYCAKGEFRRNLVAAGFAVQRLPGPPGKREMIRAEKI